MTIIGTPQKVIYVSQPSYNVRLTTYPSGKLPDESHKSLGSSAFARHYLRNHWLFSLPQGTKMFQFRWLPLPTLYIQVRVTRHNSSRVSPFGYPRIKACLAAPRGLSQLTTSFIGILRQGIPCVRLSNFLRNTHLPHIERCDRIDATSYWYAPTTYAACLNLSC